MIPEISVVMSVYNAKETVAHAVESVLSQTFRNFEFIIVDDGSSDETSKILHSFSDDRIKILKNNHNYIDSLNIGMSHAKGRFIARMDADDYMHPDRLRFQVNFMKTHTDIDICGTWMQTYGRFYGIISNGFGKIDNMV